MPMTTTTASRFKAQTDEVTSLLRIVNLVRNGEATTRPEIGRVTGLGRGVGGGGGGGDLQKHYINEMCVCG